MYKGVGLEAGIRSRSSPEHISNSTLLDVPTELIMIQVPWDTALENFPMEVHVLHVHMNVVLLHV